VSGSAAVRFRHNVAVPLAGFVGIVALLPLAGNVWFLSPLLLLPAAVMVWGWRTGVDADSDGLTVRALLGSRRLPWHEVTGFTTQGRLVYATLDGDRAVRLPAVTVADVPTLIEASGQQLDRDDHGGDQ
jgi:hypothetical protein